MDEQELLFSRQLCVLGAEQFARVRNAAVLVIGAGGVGAELAKSLILSGVRALVLADSRPVGRLDELPAATNFCVREGDDAGAALAAVTAQRMSEELSLGTALKAYVGDVPLDAGAPFWWESSFAAVCATEGALEAQARLGDVCRSRGLPFVAARCSGALARVFVDTGGPAHLPMREAAGDAGRVHGPRGVQCHAAALALDEAAAAGPAAARAAATSRAAALGLPPAEAEAAGALAEAAAGAAGGAVAALEALAGSVAAHEALKLVARRAQPLCQWLYADAAGLLPPAPPQGTDGPPALAPRQAPLARALGPALCERLRTLRVLLVGAGALGCELLKGAALLGLCSLPAGRLTVADPDVVRPANLPSQCLYRASDVGAGKAAVAVERARAVAGGAGLAAEAVRAAVSDAPDAAALGGGPFFRSLHAVVCGADAVAARVHADGRCAGAGVALVDGGVDGPLGHVQVTVPFLSELYADGHDPGPEEPPLCAIESFPTAPGHAVDWARGRFERAFVHKPAALAALAAGTAAPPTDAEAAGRTARAARRAPGDWAACVAWARAKFDRCFVHAPSALLHAFPPDAAAADGTPFWATKRRPRALPFDAADAAHSAFVAAAAALAARVYGVPPPPEAADRARVAAAAGALPARPFVPKRGAKIVTEEGPGHEAAPAEAPAEDAAALQAARDELARAREELLRRLPAGAPRPQPYDPEGPDGAHLAFVAAAARLRARCYGLEEPAPLEVLRRSLRLAPALVTTAGAVAALQLLQLLQLARRSLPGLQPPAGQDGRAGALPLAAYANSFLNLDTPALLAAAPAAARRLQAGRGAAVAGWERWEVRGREGTTVGQFVHAVEDERGLAVTGVFSGVTMVFMPLMPGHKKRLPKPLLSFVQPEAIEPWEGGARAVELVLSYEDEEGEDVPGPPVRFLF